MGLLSKLSKYVFQEAPSSLSFFYRTSKKKTLIEIYIALTFLGYLSLPLEHILSGGVNYFIFVFVSPAFSKVSYIMRHLIYLQFKCLKRIQYADFSIYFQAFISKFVLHLQENLLGTFFKIHILPPKKRVDTLDYLQHLYLAIWSTRHIFHICKSMMPNCRGLRSYLTTYSCCPFF